VPGPVCRLCRPRPGAGMTAVTVNLKPVAAPPGRPAPPAGPAGPATRRPGTSPAAGQSSRDRPGLGPSPRAGPRPGGQPQAPIHWQAASASEGSPAALSRRRRRHWQGGPGTRHCRHGDRDCHCTDSETVWHVASRRFKFKFVA
jgi:hypothetical protein